MTRPAFSLCICPDSYLLRVRLDALLAAHPPVNTNGDGPDNRPNTGADNGPGNRFGNGADGAGRTGGAWQRHVFWGDDGLTPAFWEHLTLQGLFAVPKALVIRNAHTLPADTLAKQLAPALQPLVPKRGNALPSTLIWPLICLEVGFEKGKPKVPAHIQKLSFWQDAEARGWIDATPPLAGKALGAFIRAEASRHGLTLRPAETALLEEALPSDAALVSSELAKLALMADSDGRLPGNAVSFVGQAQELGIFELMRLVQQNSNTPAVWRRILEDRLSGENMVFAFAAIVLREARVLWQCLAGTPPPLPPQIAMQKKMTAQALGFAGLARLWEIALAADKGIKSGERSPDQAFEMLAAELFVLFGGRQPR